MNKFNEKLKNSKFSFGGKFKYITIIFGVFLLIAIVLSVVFGINMATNLKGGYEINAKLGTEIDGVEKEQNLKTHKKEMLDILKSENAKVEIVLIEGSGLDSAIVVRFKTNNMDSTKIASIETKLNDYFTEYFKNQNITTWSADDLTLNKFDGKASIMNIIGVAVSGIVVLVLGGLLIFWRHNIFAALISVATTIAELAFATALTIIAQIPLTFAGIAVLLLGVMLSQYDKFIDLENIDEDYRSKNFKDGDYSRIANNASKESLIRKIIITAVAILTSIGFAISTPALITYSILPLLIMVPTVFAGSLFVSTPSFAKLVDKKHIKPRKRFKRKEKIILTESDNK